MPFTHARRIATASSVVVLSALGVGLVTAPAVAAVTSIATSTFTWSTVDDSTGSVLDAAGTYSTNGGAPGYVFDAFDGVGTIGVQTCGTTLYPTFGGATTSAVPGGTSTVTGGTWTGNANPGTCGDATATLAMTFQGNVARWDWTFGGDVEAVQIFTDLGSDGTGAFTAINADTLVTYDTDGNDLSVALAVNHDGTGGAWNVSILDAPTYAVTAPTSLSFATAVADWVPGAPGSQQASYDFLLGVAPDLLGSEFGFEAGPFGGTDAPAFPAQSFTMGTPVAAVATFTTGSYFSTYFDPATNGLMTATADFGTLPAGLTGTVSYDAVGAPTFQLAGTPTTPGTYRVPVNFWLQGDTSADDPFTSFLTITVSAVAAAPAPQLAAAGPEAAPLALGGSAVLALGLMAFWASRRRRTEA